MTDKEKYKTVFSHLHASGAFSQEAKHMNKGRIRKSLLIGIAAAALMATAAGAANIATDGAFFEGVKLFIDERYTVSNFKVNNDGSREFDAVDQNGNDIHVSIDSDISDITDGNAGIITITGDNKKLAEEYENYVVVNAEDGSVIASKSHPEKESETVTEYENGTLAHSYTVTTTPNNSEEATPAPNN